MNAESDLFSYAVTVAYAEGQWSVRRFRDDFTDLRVSINAVRGLRAPGAAFALLCVDDDYFAIVRPGPKDVRLLLSDATAAVEDDFAADILGELDVDVPDLDPEELDDVDPWAEGDFDILEDLGLSADALGIVAEDDELWPSEALMSIAEDLGFSDELSDVLE